MKYLEEGKFDMVLTDLGMPAMTRMGGGQMGKAEFPRIPVAHHRMGNAIGMRKKIKGSGCGPGHR